MSTTTLPRAARGEYEGIFTKVERAEDGAVRWKATVSDDGVDRYNTRMTADLFDDFIRNFNLGVPAWHTIAHFYGLARIGETTALYRDGRKLKAEGRFFTDAADPFVRELATAAANAALDDARQNKLASKRAIKTSIGFTPRASVVEDMGVIAYTMGELNEITMTTHAANSRTDFGGEAMTQRALDLAFMEEDAASIVGAPLAKQLREKAEEIRQRAGGTDDVLSLLYRAYQEPFADAAARVRAWSEGGTGKVEDAEINGLLHHDVQDGALVLNEAAVITAATAAPEEARAHLAEHYTELERTPPWRRTRESLAHRIEEIDELRTLTEAGVLTDEKAPDVAIATLAEDIAEGNITQIVGLHFADDGTVTAGRFSVSLPTLRRPYKGPDDEKLPANVKKMPEDKRKVWIKTFNAASNNGASDADAMKAANTFVKNMNAKEDKSIERAGRKIQGKKLAEMQAAIETLSGIVAYAAEEKADDDEDRSFIEQLAVRFAGEPISEDGLQAVTEQRYMELTGAESLAEVLDFNEMHQYMCTLIYTLQDLIMANLNPENEMGMEERMANIDQAIGDFGQLINGMIGSYFSNGRSAPDDNTDMKDVKPTANGTAPVKAAGASEAAEVRTVLDRMVEAVEKGDAAGVQDALNDLGPALETALPEEPVPPAGEMPAEVREELNELRMGQQAILQTLEALRENRQEPAPIEAYKPQPPRRASYSKPPTQRSYPAPRTEEPSDSNGIRGRSIREIAERGTPRSRFP